MVQANIILNTLCGLKHSNFEPLLLALSVYNQSESREAGEGTGEIYYSFFNKLLDRSAIDPCTNGFYLPDC
jgi:hypothetical protein